LARAFRSARPDLTVAFHEVTGSVGNLEAIQDGQADIGFAFADDAHVAFIGHEGERPFDRLRGIAVLQLHPLHLVVSAQSQVGDIRELRGRRVSIGPPGGENFVLRAFGLDESSVTTEHVSGSEAIARLRAGTLAGAFILGALPAQTVKAATVNGARVLPIEGPAVDRLRQAYPFWHLVAIPPHTYAAQPLPVHTIGVHSVLVCASELDEQLVYDLTREFFAALPILSTIDATLGRIDFSQAPATPIPLHDGAGRYYRERELSR
jgi:TRAP transporter TAXI family solute receptor